MDVVNENGDTAMLWASLNGKIEMVKLLQEIKADMNVCGCDGTAMHQAVRGGQTEMLKVTDQQFTVDDLSRTILRHCAFYFATFAADFSMDPNHFAVCTLDLMSRRCCLSWAVLT